MQELGLLMGPTKILSSNSIISDELSDTEFFFICCPAVKRDTQLRKLYLQQLKVDVKA